MRRTLLVLALTMLATLLAGCPFFTRDEVPASGSAEPAAADPHAGHDHP
jgi:outer membrane lipopolysaccharide assembly protein LptE/RlpB